METKHPVCVTMALGPRHRSSRLVFPDNPVTVTREPGKCYLGSRSKVLPRLPAVPSRKTESVSRKTESVSRKNEAVSRKTESVSRKTESVSRKTESVSRGSVANAERQRGTCPLQPLLAFAAQNCS